MIDLRDFLGGKYLQKEDVTEPKVVTISRVEVHPFEGEEKKVIIFLEELKKGLVANKTNLRTAVSVFGTENDDEWKGKRIVLFNDVNVSFQGRRTGGLRLRALGAAEELDEAGKEVF